MNSRMQEKSMPEMAPRGNALPDKTKLGVGLFLLSEANFFLILLVAYVYFHSLRASGPSAANSLNPLHTLAFSICLFLSSATIHLAGRSFKLGEHRDAGLWLALTVALGAIFLFGQTHEYLGLFAHGVTISTNLFGSTFFTLTGFHGLHVLFGLCALAALLGIAMSGRLAEVKPSGFEAVSMYWHFVDAVWVVIFAVVYLWPLIA
jgi:heme/copper-type cytochrome/quinol oxidase subunit 3